MSEKVKKATIILSFNEKGGVAKSTLVQGMASGISFETENTKKILIDRLIALNKS